MNFLLSLMFSLQQNRKQGGQAGAGTDNLNIRK
jgi:hypothetical protein